MFELRTQLRLNNSGLFGIAACTLTEGVLPIKCGLATPQ